MFSWIRKTSSYISVISRVVFAEFSRTSKSVIATDEVNFITTATELCVFTLPVCNVPQA